MSVPDRVYVTIPTYKTPPEMLRRSVESVLNQSHTSFNLMVMCDGEPFPDVADAIYDLDDSRLIIVGHDVNQGRYACDHAIVGAIASTAPGQLWAPLDSDDWAEPDWLERLLSKRDETGADVVFCYDYIHREHRRRPGVEPVKAWDGTDRLRWHAHISGLWSVDFVRRWNLTNPSWRIAWDTIMTSAPWVVGRVAVCATPLVHRTIRPNSLTTAVATRFGSTARNEARKRCEEVWSDLVAHPDRTAEILSNA